MKSSEVASSYNEVDNNRKSHLSSNQQASHGLLNKNARNESELASDEVYDNVNVKYKRLSCLKKFRNMLKSNCMNAIIIVLVVFECLSVAGEISIDYIDLRLTENYHKYKLNQTILQLDLLKYNLDLSEYDYHSYLLLVQHIFKFICIIIQFIFVIEILVKFIFIPKIFFCKLIELLDAIIVFSTVSLNLYLFYQRHYIHSITGILLILR